MTSRAPRGPRREPLASPDTPRSLKCTHAARYALASALASALPSPRSRCEVRSWRFLDFAVDHNVDRFRNRRPAARRFSFRHEFELDGEQYARRGEERQT